MCPGHFYLELKGLAPGRYHYKYIIDNTWAVDGLAPKVLDSQVRGQRQGRGERGCCMGW